MVFNGDFFFFNIKLLRFLYRKSQGSSDLIAVNFCTGSIVFGAIYICNNLSNDWHMIIIVFLWNMDVYVVLKQEN